MFFRIQGQVSGLSQTGESKSGEAGQTERREIVMHVKVLVVVFRMLVDVVKQRLYHSAKSQVAIGMALWPPRWDWFYTEASGEPHRSSIFLALPSHVTFRCHILKLQH